MGYPDPLQKAGVNHIGERNLNVFSSKLDQIFCSCSNLYQASIASHITNEMGLINDMILFVMLTINCSLVYLNV